MNQELTPEQKKQVTKSKAILWIGLIFIVLAGMAIAVYFVFVQAEDQGNVNVVSNSAKQFITPCNWQPTKDYGLCEMSLGAYFDGEKCVAISGCTKDDTIPYTTLEDCELDCLQWPAESATLGWQTYEDEINGYSLLIPENYGKNTELEGYLALDVVTASSATLTYNRIIVTVSDIDLHTQRLIILTSPAANTENLVEKDVEVSGLTGTKLTFKNALGETMIHYLVAYLGKVYDIETTDSVDQDIIDTFVSNFSITQLDTSIDIADSSVFESKTCISNNECGAYPCLDGTCYIQECNDESDCDAGVCGQYVTPVPGYCTMIDSL